MYRNDTNIGIGAAAATPLKEGTMKMKALKEGTRAIKSAARNAMGSITNVPLATIPCVV